MPSSDWKYCASGGTFATPGTVTALPVNVCMKNGFDGTKLYQLVYTAKDPYVLLTGTAAFRDVQPFFRYSAADDFGTPNPVANNVKWAIIRGSSQSGNFTRHLIFLGMNEDEAQRIANNDPRPSLEERYSTHDGYVAAVKAQRTMPPAKVTCWQDRRRLEWARNARRRCRPARTMAG